MKIEWTKKWWKALAVRTLRTCIQIVLTYVTVGATISEIKWGELLGSVLVGALYTVLTGMVGGLPEGIESEEDES